MYPLVVDAVLAERKGLLGHEKDQLLGSPR